jgi:putative ABC transport system permease protein
MRWPAIAEDILEGVRSHPGRTAISFAGIGVGMAAFGVLLGILAGIERETRLTIRGLGANVFAIVQPTDGTAPNPDRMLTRGDVQMLRRHLEGCEVTGLSTFAGPACGLERGATLVAADEHLFRVRPWRLADGRGIDARDVADRAPHAVASRALAETLDLRPGRALRVLGTPLTVVGIADLGDGALGSAPSSPAAAPGEAALFVPWTLPPYWLTTPGPPADRIDAVYVRVPDPDRLDEAVRRTRALLDQPGNNIPGLAWVTPRELVRGLTRLQTTIGLAGGSLVVLCLILSGATLMSVLLANIQQRVPEIGLRRALGASALDVGWLFMAEACAVSVLASAAGSALAVILLRVGRELPVPVLVNAWTILLPVLGGAAMGVAFSFWPAVAAARIAPAEALRNG